MQNKVYIFLIGVLLMARGGPDYNSPDFAVAVSADTPDQSFVAEYGISPLTSMGRVYLVDFFDGGLTGWQKTSSGGGNNPVWEAVDKRTFIRPLAVTLAPVASGGESVLTKDVSTFMDSKHGIEIIFTSDANHGHLILTFQHVTQAGLKYTYVLSYNHLDGTWRIGQPTTGTTFRTEQFSGTFQQRFVRLKVVFDIPNARFDSMYLGNLKINLTAYTPTSAGSTSIGFSSISIDCKGADGTKKEPIYIAGIIWSVDEP